MPIVTELAAEPVETNLWDIPYSIPKLSYLTHSHFRYYGKFPPVVAGLLIDNYPPPSADHYIFDNFCGSGTTLVEAAVRGHNAYGIDANWLAVLASNVKVRHISLTDVKLRLSDALRGWEDHIQPMPDEAGEEKWFTPRAAADLTALASILKQFEPGPATDFLILAFLAIIRRVSRAFDGEVRPHINKDKKPRDVRSAFSKKVRDMMSSHAAYMELSPPHGDLECLLGDNRDLRPVPAGNLYLAISHPPYLNSFNYRPVFSLERRFAEGFAPSAADTLFRETELLAHPANASVIDAYFAHLKSCYEALHARQDRGSYLAVVIGDCTVKHQLVPVVDMTADILEPIGYDLAQINYRTTHYGLGKYAYSHRADYHGEAQKKDGILVFKRR